MNPEQTPVMGMIQGGWDYVYAAYGISFAVLIGYALLTIFWLGQARARKEQT